MKKRLQTALAYRAASLLAVGLTITVLAQPMRAASITLQGTINADHAVQLLNVTVASPGIVDFRSYGYAGGLTASGAVVPSGGFDTILTLFNASGVFLDENDDGAGVATDPTTGLAADARITGNLATGNYILAVTQYDNFSLGDLADGFTETGHPNFAADSSFASGGACPGDLFRDISDSGGRCRSGDWAVSFGNVASVTPVAPVPEPSALFLAGLGSLLLLVGRSRFLRKAVNYRTHFVGSFRAAVLGYGVLVAVGGAPAQAQSNCPTSTSGPDYCHVSDYLDGERSLLQVTDLQAFRLDAFSNTGTGNIYYGQDIYQIQTSGSQQTLSNELHQQTAQADPSAPLLSFSAHMVAQPSASTLTTMANFQNSKSFALWLQNVDSLNRAPGWWSPLDPGDNPTVLAGAVGDLTGDGYDDLALSFDDGKLIVLTPKNLNDVHASFSKGLLITAQLQALAIGDFNGDGHREIAGVTRDPNTGGVSVVIYTVDQTTLTLTAGPELALNVPSEVNAGNPVARTSLTSGRFNNSGHDQVAIAFGTATGPVYLEVIDFAPGTLNPQEGPRLVASTVSGYVQAIAAPFGLPGNSNDQVLFHNSGAAATGAKFFKVFSVDPTSLVLSPHAGIEYDSSPCVLPLQVGNFDHRQADPSNPGNTVPNPTPQIAFLYCNGSPYPDNPSWKNYNKLAMSIYNVDPTTFDISANPASQLDLGPGFFISPNAGETSATFVATDLQGRSLVLSDPTKISISSSIQPTAVVGAPPMHVDFIDPGDGNGPRVFNVSVVPDGFQTTYNQQSSRAMRRTPQTPPVGRSERRKPPAWDSQSATRMQTF